MQFGGTLYRALNPFHAREPLSGRGAQLYGGRFNLKGTPALYTSLSVMTALRQANQVGSLQPTTLVSYSAEIDRVFDCRDAQALLAEGIDEAVLAGPAWREQMRANGAAETQIFARKLADSGYRALLVPSFAHGATKKDLNLVLWKWSGAMPSRITLIDDEGRLSR
ncbi:RES family NAD+ phosphorylase [Rhizobium sp. Rhizsp42]|uniref:RES family NAD+ phosphorylase n=1 Tax=Rhizobium sp. Rhizsp42 TaxID=3243034 RepID=UPI0039B04FC7